MPFRRVSLAAHCSTSLVWCVALCALWTSVCHAQVTPSGLGTSVTGTGAYEIRGGTRSADSLNLFHGFSEFSLGVAESATFINDLGAPTTANIFSRVSGVNPSTILGSIDTATDFPAAHFWLINPNGVVFGPTASLNIGGSVHFSTADSLLLRDDVTGQLRTFGGGTIASDVVGWSFTSAPVEAFGFVRASPSAIEVQGSNLALVSTDQSLSLVGGNVTMAGGVLSAPGPNSRINVVSVAAPGEVSVPSYQLGPGMQGGNISLTAGALLDVTGDGGGTIVIRGGQLSLDNSFLLAETVAGSDGGLRAIDVNVSGAVMLSNGSGMFADGFGTGTSGDIVISANSVQVSGGSTILTSNADGQAGNVTVAGLSSVSVTGTDTFGTPSSIQSLTFASGNSGAVTIQAGSFNASDLGTVQTNSFGSGNPGNVTVIAARDASITGGGSIASVGGGISSGNVLITADSVSISGEAGGVLSRIENLNGGGGATGDISVNVRQLLVTNSGRINSASATQSGTIMIAATESVNFSNQGKLRMQNDSGPGGLLTISAPILTLESGGNLQTSTIGAGNAGAIVLNVGAIGLNGGQVTSEAAGSGLGGAIQIQSSDVRLSDNSTISASSTGTGDAGNITVNAGKQLVMNDSSITTQASQASGGNITVLAGDLVYLRNSSINTSVAGGPVTVGGNILIDPPIVILQNSQILAQALAGAGGNITIVAGALFVDPSSTISASSQTGISGSVSIQTPVTFLSGTFGQLPKTPMQASSLLQAHCAARAGGEHSSFVQRGRDGLPPEPGGWLASPMLAAAGSSEMKIGRGGTHESSDMTLVHEVMPESPLLIADAHVGPLVGTPAMVGSSDCGS